MNIFLILYLDIIKYYCKYFGNKKNCLFPENTHDSTQINNIEIIDGVNTCDVMTNDIIENDNILIADMDVSVSCMLLLNIILEVLCCNIL